MSGRDRLVVLTGVVVLGLLGAAIGLPSPATPSSSPGPSSPPLEATLREGVVGRATSINPLVPRSAADLDLVALVFSGLTRSLPDGSVGPDLAERWTVSRDGRVYTFTLRGGVTWQDGRPLTADDVVFTILTIQDPDYQGPLAASWKSVTVEKVDARTVRFTLADPLGAFLQATTLPILPAHFLVGTPVAALPDAGFNRAPMGSGPYRLVRLGFDQADLELVGSGAGSTDAPAPPALQQNGLIRHIVVRFYPDGASLAAAYRAGEVDTAAGLLPQQALELAAEAGTQVVHYPTTEFTGIVLNVRPGKGPFADANVRRGLLQALDRGRISSAVYGGAAEAADSPISPASWAYDARSSTVWRYDRNAAAAWLRKAGWTRTGAVWQGKDRRPITLAVTTIDANGDPLDDAVARLVVAQWRAIGLDVTLVELSAQAYVTQLVQGDFQAAVLDVNMGLDPDVFPLLTSSQALEGGSNVGGYQSAALDTLLRAARLGVDRTARKAAFAALEAALTRDVPILPVAFPDELYVVRATVEGPSGRLVADRSGRFWDVLTWRLADGRAAESAVAR